jgi:hypothetical protein
VTVTSFLDTALGQRLLDALKGGVPNDISVAVGEIRGMVWDDALDASLIGEVLQVLQEHRRFEDVIAVAEAAWAVGAIDTTLSRRYCQSLIETGALHAAELVATGMAETCDDDRERGEAFGLTGRVHKERFIAGGRPADLLAAIDSCLAGYRLGTDPLWHGVNLVALASRAERDGIAVPADFDVTEVTASVLEKATARHPDLRSVWERATEIECLMAGEVSDAALARATTAAESLATARLANPFELQALRRQLVEVWELPPQHPVLLAIADRELQLGAGAEVELPESAFQLEKIFGTALPVGYRNLARGLSCAESVCKITDRSEEPWGTGFLVSGALIHPDLGEKPILVTNAHVVSPEPGVGKLLPGEARAAFDVTKSTAGQELVITGLESVWSSPPGRCDVTFLEFAGPDPVIGQPVEVAAAPPPVTEGAYVYVIGHPAGGGLKFSIRGNDLLAYDTALAKVHYTAPTEGGSSGSPVFNTAWELMAVHHAGDSKMRRLDDSTNTYQANEGITIQAIREEYAHGR